MLRALSLAFTTAITLLAAPAAFADPGEIAWTTWFRIGPGRNYAVRDEVPSTTRVDVLGCDQGWCRVIFGNRVGYVESQVVTQPQTAIAPVAPHDCVANRRNGYGKGDELSICER